MGTWGTGIFEDDLALDVKAFYTDTQKQGMSVAEGTRETQKRFASSLTDPDERSTVLIALAACQKEQGTIDPVVQNNVRAIVENGEAFKRWTDASEEDQATRRQILADLIA